ncbi:murein biosynthesis integral membrane protein MurJ [Tepidibacter formicigenes]|jgi:putative peptidoglycan lipid II flippase|uniref:Probable lipid II flippase MurJ n=1 Tax=Tepidibacter formicigenes DSM 15518 TaxID=1123349 RepID=A0A1M6QD52_9FIRM|nr:murein biosynthesis integral membrane protein MurJ [Tepidibacter formicigenes]SHK18121.1 putative peptidoglycan lipid II flippase [Tepidibacter formicigenes DSM 15518]
MSKLARSTIGLMIVTLLAKILGFSRELVLASVYGTSAYSDAYLIALNIPVVIFATIGGALATTFIPLYFESNNIDGDTRSLKFANNVFNIVMIISIIVALLGIVFTKPLVKLFAVGFRGNTLKTAIDFTRILIPGIIFIGFSNIMTSYLQIKNNFTIPGLISVPYNIIIIISMLVSIKYGPYTMVWGTLIGMISKFLFQVPFAYRNGYKYEAHISLKDEYLRKMVWLVGPVFIGIAVNQINAMIDRTLASVLPEGSISALNYANKLNQFIMAFFITSIAAVIYPMLSKLSSENNKEKFVGTVVKSINSIIILVMPVSVGAIVLATPVVKFLFQRGAFNITATKMTSIALVFYSIGLIGYGLRDILGRVFYSLKDTKTPMINGAMAMIMNIILNLILVKFMGHAGLAFATSISALICIFLLFNSLKKKIGYFGQDKILKTTLKSLASAIVMGIITFFTYKFLIKVLGLSFITEAIALFGSVFIGALVYGILVIILKVEEVNMIIDMINRKLKRKSYIKEKSS